MNEFNDDRNCFVCGTRNAAGLQLAFGLDAEGASAARVLFPAHLQGWQGTVHGGMLATVLDEAMIKAAGAAGHKCVTAEITVKYRRPAPTGAELALSGRMKEARGRMVLAESRVQDAQGNTLAEATGKLFKIE